MIMRSLPWLMVPTLLFVSSAPAPRPDAPSQVTAFSLAHAGGQAKLTIGVRGAIDVKDSILRNPDRVILDFAGASLGTVPSYDHQSRGHVRDVRYQQLTPEVVRVVVEVDRLPAYVVHSDGPGRI